MGFYGLFDKIMCIVQDSHSDVHTLTQFEKYGISFEATIEYCAKEIEYKEARLVRIIYKICSLDETGDITTNISESEIQDLSKSVSGRKMAEQLIEKIRSCSNWEELYIEMLPAALDMIRKSSVKIKQCRKI